MTKSGNNDLADHLWKAYTFNGDQAVHHEKQRATLTGLVLAISAAIIGLITFDRSVEAPIDTLLSLFLVALGSFGAMFSMKQYERSQFHVERSRGYRRAIEELLPGEPMRVIKNQADLRHRQKFPHLTRVRLYAWWLALCLAPSAVGGVLCAISILAPIKAPAPAASNVSIKPVPLVVPAGGGEEPKGGLDKIQAAKTP